MSDLGELTLMDCYSADDTVRYLTVTRADPEVAMSHELFHWLFLHKTPCTGIELVPGPDGSYQGALLKIHAVNGTWIYRVEKFLDHKRGWLLRWPD